LQHFHNGRIFVEGIGASRKNPKSLVRGIMGGGRGVSVAAVPLGVSVGLERKERWLG
jgi:hypothetical protein